MKLGQVEVQIEVAVNDGTNDDYIKLSRSFHHVRSARVGLMKLLHDLELLDTAHEGEAGE